MFEELLKDNNKRHLGPILLMEFILFDVLKIFFVFLAGTGMLSCLPPYYSVDNVTHLLKNCMKAFLATWMGVPFLKFCAKADNDKDDSDSDEMISDNSDDNNNEEYRVTMSDNDNMAFENDN